ncbi:MAG: hypothetical protein RBT80_13290 [Candidatus Vecturithrix sp.]|nr:hypothetical protein [Candidatus Vecturithrix sp.]
MKVHFIEIKIHANYGKVVNRIYHVVENGRPLALGPFKDINQDLKDKVKDLISKMATVKNYKSPMITNHLKGYNYGEIRPKPHRFFFFHKYGTNIIFFSYVLKKKDSFPNSFYAELSKEKERYEREFEKFIERNRRNI